MGNFRTSRIQSCIQIQSMWAHATWPPDFKCRARTRYRKHRNHFVLISEEPGECRMYEVADRFMLEPVAIEPVLDLFICGPPAKHFRRPCDIGGDPGPPHCIRRRPAFFAQASVTLCKSMSRRSCICGERMISEEIQAHLILYVSRRPSLLSPVK